MMCFIIYCGVSYYVLFGGGWVVGCRVVSCCGLCCCIIIFWGVVVGRGLMNSQLNNGDPLFLNLSILRRFCTMYSFGRLM